MENWTLVIISAKTCGACKTFMTSFKKPLLEKLEKEKVTVKHYEFETLNSSAPANLPKHLYDNYIRWFPIFIAFTNDDFKEVEAGTEQIAKRNIVGHVLNGEFVNGKLTHSGNKYPFSDVGVYTWLKSLPLPKQNEEKTSTAKITSAYGNKNDNLLQKKEQNYFPTAPLKTCTKLYVSSFR